MNWEKVKLGEILKRRKEAVMINPNEEYKLVTIRIHHKGVIQRCIAKGSEIKSPMSIVRAGDFILSGIDARNGAFGIVPSELDGAIVTNDFWSLDSDDTRIDKGFLLFLTSTDFFDFICKQSSEGVTQRIRLQKDKFFNFEIALPPVEEQKQIMDKLKEQKQKSEDLTAQLTCQLSLVKKLRQQLLQDAVQGKLVDNSEAAGESAHELLKRIKAEKEQLIKEKKLKKEKELPPIKAEEIPFEIPEDWVWCRLGEICDYGTSPKAEPKELTDETWVLDLEDIEKETSKLLGKIRFSERNSLSTKSVFKKGDVLYSKLRPYLDKVIVADENGVCTTEILPLGFHGNLNPFYLMFTLKSKNFLSYVNSVTKGMKMPRLGTKEGQLALIPLPPLSTQHLIVEKVEGMMQLCDGLEASIGTSMRENEQLLQQVLREALQG